MTAEGSKRVASNELSVFVRGPTTAHLVNLLAILIFSVNYVVGRGVYEDAPPFMLGFTRWAGAAVLLAPIAVRHVRADWPLLVENWRMVTACGLLMPFIGAGLAYTALTMTVAINVAVVQTALPVFTVLLAWIILKDRLTAAQAIGLCGAILGVLCIISRGDPAILMTLSFNSGDLLMVFCNLGLAGYAVLVKRLPPIRPLAFLFAICVIGAAFHVPFLAIELATGKVLQPTLLGLGGLAFVAVFPSIVAILSWNFAISRLGPSTSGFYFYLVPVITAGLAYLFLDETVAWYHFAGGAVIFASVWLAGRGAQPRLRRLPGSPIE